MSMENNEKLKKNFLQKGVSKIGGKIAKLLPPALVAATMLNCATLSAQPNNKTAVKAPTASYYDATVNNYTANAKSFADIYNSKLFNMNEYSVLEKKIHADLADLLVKSNEETIKLSSAYKTMEVDSTLNSNMLNQEINQIAGDRGAKTSDTKNMHVAKIEMQHFLHLILDTTTLIRLGADEAQISSIDEHNDANQNEYLRFNTKGQRDIRTESEVVLGLGQMDIAAYTEYAYKVAGKNGNTAAATLNNNLARIKSLINQPGQSQAEYNQIMTLVEQTANLLPQSLFGNYEMRKALVLEYAQQYTINAMLDKLEKLGYTVKDFKAQDQLNTVGWSIDTLGTQVDITNKGAHISLGLDSKISKPNSGFDLKLGTEVGANVGGDHAIQVLGKVEPGYTFNNGQRLSMPLKGGLEVTPGADKKISTPFGAGVTYNIPLNNKMSIDIGGSSLVNIQKQNVSLGGAVGWSYDTGKLKLRVGIGFGHNIEWGNSQPSIDNPTIDDPSDEPTIDEPTVDDPTVDEPTVDDPSNNVEIENPDDLLNSTNQLPTVDADPSKFF